MDANKQMSEIKITQYDFDPNTTDSTAVGWVDMRDFSKFLVSFFRTVGTSDITLLIRAATSAAGANVQTILTKTIAAQPDAVGDYVFAECLAEQIAQTADVLGLTTSMSQNFASLALARRVKELNPDVFVVLGGSGTRQPAGMSLLKEYAFVDAIVEGEGERPFLDLLRGLSERTLPDKNIPGVVTRASELPIITWEMPDLDDLPFPDFGEYLSLADRYNILWLIPIEGSRGCWWDQSVRTGDPARRCYFCNYSDCTYRSKSAARIAREMSVQAEKYQNTRFGFCDNVAVRHGVTDLADAILAEKKQFSFFR